MIKPLTSLRFVFALMVFFDHIATSAINVDIHMQWLSDNVFREGYVGVGFFFVLSGFILAYNYKDKFSKKEVNKKNFWIMRLARVYPLHLLTLYLSVPMVLMLWNYDLTGILFPFFLNLFLLQSYILPPFEYYWSFNTVSWSVSDEMFFYFLFPFIINFLNKKKELLIALVLLACIAIPLLMLKTSNMDMRPVWFYIHPFFRIVDFLIGILLYEIYLKMKDSKILKFASILELFSVLLFVLFFLFHNSVPQVYRSSCYYWLPISSIILIFSFQKGVFSQMFLNKHLVYLGEISYGFYMFHALVIQYFIILNANYSIFENYYLFVFFMLCFSIFISAICHSAFEKPINKYIVKRFCR
ncbi:MAG: acyltransferase [Bacteroidota bacterium]